MLARSNNIVAAATGEGLEACLGCREGFVCPRHVFNSDTSQSDKYSASLYILLCLLSRQKSSWPFTPAHPFVGLDALPA